MKLLLATILLLPSMIFAQTLDCSLIINNTVVEKNKVEITKGEKTAIFNYEDLKVSSIMRTATKFEIEVFNPFEPSRSYAVGELKEITDDLSLVSWKREQILEVNCTLVAQ
ncbi:hypothetical protein [Bacteriovorax sp. Seq25_V]|uniref:hypothetical protein n=1 Tax=Bacteriovorax sp. Seq25_V TaxID=1201288 RepID=UPI00038A3BC4|nr:hypothetical protein [Bacteriovorax sp. Seq25_V]EQC43801.1 hypothetical protein M900_1412 [Bacteriovorax sp. Seq25_V]